MHVETELGDEDDVRSLFVDIRKLLMSGEVVHFFSIVNLLEERLTDGVLHDANRRHRQSWKQALKGRMQLIVDGKSYDAMALFNVFANGGLFHVDPELVGEMQRFGEPIRSIALTEVNSMVSNCLRVAYAERNLIQRALNEGLVDLS